MARQIQLRRGTTAEHSTFTGAVGEVTVDTDKDVVVIHDGSTAGGFPLARQLSDLGITATATELNYVDGVTSNVQTQLNAKGTVSSLSDLSITATATELNYVDGVTSAIQTQLDAKGTVSSLADLSITATATELNYVDGVTSAIQTQLDAKGTVSSLSDLGITATATELNYVDGVTSAIQTQLDAKITADVTGEFIADSYNETYAAVTSTSNATTVNCETGNSFMHTLTENTTFTFSNPPASGTAYSMSIEIIQDASASGFTVTWPSSVDWPAATAPTLTATASAKDVFVFTTRDGGTTWLGFTAGQALA